MALLLGCGSGAAETAPPAAAGSTPPSDAIGGDQPPAAAVVGQEGPTRVTFDLARHLERAELRHGSSFVVDFGSSQGAQAILGGFGNAMAMVEVEGRSFAVSRGRRATVLVPSVGERGGKLVMRARGFGGKAEVFVNGAAHGTVELPSRDFGLVTIKLASGALRRGDNLVQLLVGRTGTFGDQKDVGVAIDWLRVDEAEGRSGSDEPSKVALAAGDESGDAIGIGLGGDWAVRFTFEVPAGARLKGVARGAQGAAFVAVAHRDGSPASMLGKVEVTREGRTFEIDLGALAGDVVQLELRAKAGRVELLRPAVVEPTVTAPTPKKIRNVLVYLIDTLRADKLGPINASTRVRTPGLDAFVKHSTTFARARSQENWTKPSVATLLSSLMPWEHTATKGESVLPSSVRTMPMILGEHGFYSGAFIANGYVSDRFGFRGGWNTYRNYIRENRRTKAEYVAADVLGWLDARPKEKPFLLYVHTIDPHVPYRPPEEFLAMYGDPKYTGPVSFRKDATLLENVKMGRIRLEERDRKHLEALYDGEISYHDVHFAAILEALERRGVADETIVVVTSDHGEEFWDHGSVGHGHSVWDELLRVPLFVRVPGLTEGAAKLTSAVGLVDVLPTVLEALELPIPPELAGRSLLPELRGEGSGAPRVSVSGFHETWRAVASGRYKLIQRAGGGAQLYDVEADPQERNDLAADRPLVVRHLRGLLGLELARTSPQVVAPTKAPGRATPPKPRHREQTIEIDAATEAQLRALGYVGSSKR